MTHACRRPAHRRRPARGVGNRGVDLLLGDSTNAERPGVTGSERLVGEAFHQIIPTLTGRVLVASFASNIHRMQQAVDVAVDVVRKVCVVGRSMRKNVNIARNLGYMEVDEEVLIRPNELDDYGPAETLILCTGSQGEPLSALVRIAYGDHPAVSVAAGDTVIISAKPVPGNELRVHDAINQLARLGAEVLTQETAPVHVSGHGNAEELRTMIGLVRPKAVMPVHGEFRCWPRTRSWRGGRHPGGLDRDRRERLGGGAHGRRRAWPTTSPRGHLRGRPRRRRRATCPARSGVICPRTAS
jgi:ribonuclease J